LDYALLLAEWPDQTGPRQRILFECLRAAIRSGRLAPGARLPATRALAQELGIARNTVLYAYEQLSTEGFLEAGRAGTVVSALAGAAVNRQAAAPLRVGLSRRARGLDNLAAPANLAGAFAPGCPALDEFPLHIWRRMMDRAWRSVKSSQLNYGDAAGDMGLREAVAQHLRIARGADCDASQVFITSGTQASLDLCSQAFADAGDKVWIENPGYGGAVTAFRAAQLDVVGIAVDEQGIAPRVSDWVKYCPRLVYVTPSHQYPTGTVLTLERRLSLIAAARAAGALLIEDDYDSEFRYDGAPLSCMQGLAADAPVLYLGTFSKTMFPALRLGFIVVPRSLVTPLHGLLARSSPRGRTAEQLALAEFIHSGQFALHLRRMRRLYRERRDALVTALEKHFAGMASVHGGSAGMHLVLRLNEGEGDDTGIAAAALQAGVVLHPLSRHTTGPRTHGWNGFLMGYAQVPAEKMDGLVRKVAQCAAATRGRASNPSGH
jgi:GntR family transcriptional regulator/MocR family aminotransferase